MNLKFTKMHSCGGDFICLDCFEKQPYDPETLALMLPDRRFGIGGEALVLICPSPVADAKIRILYPDGSEGDRCGNALRCVGKYLFEHGHTQKTELTVETLSGLASLTLLPEGERVPRVRVSMGSVALTPDSLPVFLEGDAVIGREVELAGKPYEINCVSLGGPHCVLFTDEWEGFDFDRFDLCALGAQFANDPLFPQGTSVEFAKRAGERMLQMRGYSREKGETFAFDTGAAAVAVAAIQNGFAAKGEDITVRLLGGELTVNCTDDTVLVTGPAVEVFEGEIRK